MNSTRPDSNSKLRSRLTLLLIAAMFLGSFGVAAFLRFAGWTPAQGRNFGELLQPPTDLGAIQLLRADGSGYDFAPDKNIWRIVVVPADNCTTACSQAIDMLHRIWLLQGRKADRVDVLWFGPVPANTTRFRGLIEMRPNAALEFVLPEPSTANEVPVYVIDPSGFLVLHYRAGFDPAGLKKDLGKLIK